MLLYAGIAVVLCFAISRPVTTEFNQALTWLSYNYAGDQTVEAYPVFILYAGVLIDNLALFLLVGAGLVLWSYLWIPSAMLIATRAMFAWSFDRVVPDKLSTVHPRYNSPWVAVLVVAVIAEPFLILYHIGVFQFLTPALAYYFVFWLVVAVRRGLPVPATDPGAAGGERRRLADRGHPGHVHLRRRSACCSSPSGCTSC